MLDALLRARGNPPNQLPQGRFELDRSHPLAAGLIGLWPLNGDGRDYSAIQNNAALVASPGIAIGPTGPALSLDGSTQYAITAAVQGPQNGGSWAASICPSSLASAAQILSQYSNSGTGAYLQVFFLSTGDLFGRIQGPGGVDTNFIGRSSNAGAISVNRWARVLMTWNGGTTNAAVTLYIDGARVDTTDSAAGTFTGPNTTAIQIRIGAQEFAGISAPFPGLICNAAIWSRRLSAAEAARDHAEPLGLLIPARRRWNIGPAGTLTAVLLGRAAARISGKASVGGALPVVGRGEARGAGKAFSAGSVPIVGRTKAQSTGKITATVTASLKARAVGAVTAKAQAAGVVSFLGRAVTAGFARATMTFGGVAALLGRAAAIGAAKARGALAVPMSGRSGTTATAKAVFTFGGLVTLLGRAGVSLKSRASAAGAATLAARITGQANGAARPSGALTLKGHATAAGKARGAIGFFAFLSGRAAAKSAPAARVGAAASLQGRAATRTSHAGFLSGVTVLTAIAGRAFAAIRGRGTLFALRPAQPPEVDNIIVGAPVPRVFKSSAITRQFPD